MPFLKALEICCVNLVAGSTALALGNATISARRMKCWQLLVVLQFRVFFLLYYEQMTFNVETLRPEAWNDSTRKLSSLRKNNDNERKALKNKMICCRILMICSIAVGLIWSKSSQNHWNYYSAKEIVQCWTTYKKIYAKTKTRKRAQNTGKTKRFREPGDWKGKWEQFKSILTRHCRSFMQRFPKKTQFTQSHASNLGATREVKIIPKIYY